MEDFGFDSVMTVKRYYYLSYIGEDAERVSAIARHLNELGVPIWFDYGISYGSKWEKLISKTISGCEAMILFASKTTFSQEDSYFAIEEELVRELDKTRYVVWLDSFSSLSEVDESLRVLYIRLRRLQGIEASGMSAEELAKEMIDRFHLLHGMKTLKKPDLSLENDLVNNRNGFHTDKSSLLLPGNLPLPGKPSPVKGRKGLYLNPGSYRFEEALNSDIYVDKTEMIHYLNTVVRTNQKYVSVSRPRRFGKTMAADMLCAYYGIGANSYEIFSRLKLSRCADVHVGEKTLSWDAYIGKFDVVRITITDFIQGRDNVCEIIRILTTRLVADFKKAYADIEIDAGVESDLGAIMETIYIETGHQFVVVIDEWDAVFRVLADDRKGQERYLNFLRDWLKDKSFIALVYMTGILPIKKYGEHSALNMFTEYSMIAPMQMAKYTGFVSDEVEDLCSRFGRDFEEIRKWYDGYEVSDIIPPDPSHKEMKQTGDPLRAKKYSLYSPYSVRNAVSTGHIMNYWNKTESYEALAEYIRRDYDGLKEAVTILMDGGRLRVDTSSYQNDMTTFHGRDDVLSLLIHLGYLGYDADNKEVFIPNKEILDEFRTSTKTEEWAEAFRAFNQSMKLVEATWAHDEDKVAEMLENAHNRTDNKTYNSEAALSYSIRYAYYAAQKYYTMIPELDTGKGYADVAFIPAPGHSGKPALLVELKYNKDADTAISQIKRQQYPERLEHYKGNILLVGINYERDAGKTSPNYKRHTCKIEKA